MDEDGERYQPVDKHRLVQISFFVLGIGMLFPWNVFITATTFFSDRFFGSAFADNFGSFFSIAYNVSNIFFLLLSSYLIERMTEKTRVTGALVISSIIFLILTIFTKVEMDPTPFFVFVMLLVILSGGTTAALQSGVFSVSAEFPHQHTAAVMTGQGLAGLAVSLSQILTLIATNPDDPADEKSAELSALLYFLIAVVVLLLALACHLVMQRLPYFIFYTTNGQIRAKSSATEPLIKASDTVQTPHHSDSYMVIFKEIWPAAVAVWFTFVVTLGVFPGLVGNIESTTKSDSRIYNDMFVSFAFLLFNLGDLIGRSAAGWKIILTNKMLLPTSLARSIFFPLFLFCNVVLRDSMGEIIDNSIPVLIPWDAVYWLIMLAFAITNGYTASVCMIIGPEGAKKENREKAGVIMINALVFGLFTGSMCSFALRAILCKCDPFVS